MPRKKNIETANIQEPVPTSRATNKVTAWVEKINKSRAFQGKAQIRMANESRTPYFLRRPTGVLGLDIGTGGGLHAGGGVQLWGPESVGKTHLAFRAAGEHQRIYGDDASVLVYGNEIRTDKGFARKSGFCVGYSEHEISEFEEMKKAQGLPAFTSAERSDLQTNIGNVVFLAADTADTGFDAIVDALRDAIFHIVIIESLGALLTKEVDEGSVGDAHYAGSSRVMTQFQNKVYPLYMLDRPDGSLLETTIIGINQARAEIGGGPRGPKTRAAAGAYAWKHGQLLSVELGRGPDLRLDAGGPVVGKEVRWKLTKGKAGTHDGKKGDFNYYHLPPGDPVMWNDVMTTHMGGIDIATEAVDTAKQLGVIQIAGAWLSWENAGEVILRKQGTEAMANAVMEAPELLNALRAQCIEKTGIMVRYR